MNRTIRTYSWPITDESLTLRELITEADQLIPDALDRDGCVWAGEPTYEVREDGDRLILDAHVPAFVIADVVRDHDGNVVNGRKAEGLRAREALRDAMDAHPQLSNSELALLLRVSEKTIERHKAIIRREDAGAAA